MSRSPRFDDDTIDQIHALLSSGPLKCREIAHQVNLPRKAAYFHLSYMENVLGMVRMEQIQAANGGISRQAIWHGIYDTPKSDIRQRITSTWQHGEHQRDALTVAFFGSGIRLQS